MTTQEPQSSDEPGIENGEASTDAARRAFLAKCGKLAVITPPAVTLMLSAASRNYAVAGSGFPLDREGVAEELGFDRPMRNRARDRRGPRRVSPCSARSRGRPNRVKVSWAETGFPGSPRTRARSSSPKTSGLPGLMLPGQYDGFEVCQRLRKDPTTREVPVVIITAMDDDATRTRAKQAGANSFYTKPFSPIALLKEIERHLLQSFPDEIEQIWSRTGTAEVATDPMGVELTDVFLTLRDRSAWKKANQNLRRTRRPS